MVKIAVDENLSNVRSLLHQEGFDVVRLGDSSGVSAVVTSGMQENLLGIQEITEKAPVIDARGMTPHEVLATLKERLMDVEKLQHR
ncbi:MAG: YkuS family protein [Bacillota bacterium]